VADRNRQHVEPSGLIVSTPLHHRRDEALKRVVSAWVRVQCADDPEAAADLEGAIHALALATVNASFDTFGLAN
jgi:hypothetical protein